jgi:hypothetical protein
MSTTRRLATLFVAGSMLCGGVEIALAAERLVQSTTEARTVVYFKADSDAVQKLLPAGWVSTPGSGPLKDANFGMVLIEGVAAQDPEGKPVLHQGKFVVFIVPARNEQTGTAGIMVVGGFSSQPQGAPGAYGVYAPAKITMAKTSRSEESGSTTVEETWEVSTDAGDQIHFAATYERGVGTRAHVEPRIYSATKPEFHRIYRADQVTDLVHSVVADTGRSKKIEFAGAGPQVSKALSGKEKPVAVVSIPAAYYRQIFLPE